MSDRFQKVEENLPSWSPRMTGTKKENNLVKLEATDKSWIIGWYIGSRTFKSEGGDEYTIHKIKAFEVGLPETLGAEVTPEGVTCEFFGSHVVNRILADPDKVMPGQSIRVMWKGIVPAGGKVKRPYHNWEVDIDTATDPIKVMNGVVIGDNASSNNDIPAENSGAQEPAPSHADNAETFVAEGDDDLPF